MADLRASLGHLKEAVSAADDRAADAVAEARMQAREWRQWGEEEKARCGRLQAANKCAIKHLNSKIILKPCECGECPGSGVAAVGE